MTGVAAPAVTDPPPAELAGMLERLGRDGLAHIPAKRPRDNILVATWNLREFGGLTERWLSSAGDVPKRDLFSVRCIAEILGRFDVIALQEVQRDIKALRHVLKVLGEDWAFILTDVTEGDAGQNERLAFLFDTRRVQVSGLACELVVPDEVIEHNRAVAYGVRCSASSPAPRTRWRSARRARRSSSSRCTSSTASTRPSAPASSEGSRTGSRTGPPARRSTGRTSSASATSTSTASATRTTRRSSGAG
jgi:hypothetical protein